MARHASAHTQHAYYRALRRFFNWLEKRQAIADNPMPMIELPRLPACQPHHISPEEVAQLLETTAKGTWPDRRDRAIILLPWDSGMRAGELCAPGLSDASLQQQVIRIRDGKGTKDRWVAFGEKALEALESWLGIRAERARCERVFINRSGAPLTRSGVRLMLERRAGRAGIEGLINPHTFRHGFAAAYLNNGRKIHTLRRLMGHMTLRSTEVYLSVADWEAVEDHVQASLGDHLK